MIERVAAAVNGVPNNARVAPRIGTGRQRCAPRSGRNMRARLLSMRLMSSSKIPMMTTKSSVEKSISMKSNRFHLAVGETVILLSPPLHPD